MVLGILVLIYTFDISRAYDEAGGIVDPRIWTAERDADMWRNLETEE